MRSFPTSSSITTAITSPSTNVNCFGIQSSFSAYSDPAQFKNGKFRRNRLYLDGTRMEIKGCDGDCEITDNIVSGGTSSVGTDGCNESAGGGGVWCTHNAKVQNNYRLQWVARTSGAAASGAMVENNAVTGSCNIGGTTTRNGNNVCNVNASSAWPECGAEPTSPRPTPDPSSARQARPSSRPPPSAPPPGAPPTPASLGLPPSMQGRLDASRLQLVTNRPPRASAPSAGMSTMLSAPRAWMVLHALASGSSFALWPRFGNGSSLPE